MEVFVKNVPCMLISHVRFYLMYSGICLVDVGLLDLGKQVCNILFTFSF